MMQRFRLGFIVNPIAGMGGKVGLHGTDGKLLERARALGAEPISRARAARALSYLLDLRPDLDLFAGEGELGYSLAESLGFRAHKLEFARDHRRYLSNHEETFAADTRQCAQALLELDVDLILFAGGDGTARDIQSVVGDLIPILGIPTGVKMRSGVFATDPESAGVLARGLALNPDAYPLREVEVLDHAENLGEDDPSPIVFFGQAKSPYSQKLLQPPKTTSTLRGDEGISTLCRSIAQKLDAQTLYLYGPGSTTKGILGEIGLVGTPLGVDATIGRQLLAKDLSEEQILTLIGDYKDVVLFLGVIGGQGFLLGRGNQQISGQVIRKISPENIVVLSNAEKISNLGESVLHIDLGDAEVERTLEGYRKVHVAPGRSVMCRVVAPRKFEISRVAV